VGALGGINVTEATGERGFPWFTGWEAEWGKEKVTGTTLLEALSEVGRSVVPATETEKAAPLRVPVFRASRGVNGGTVCIGRVAAGTLRENMIVTILPANITTTVRSIERHSKSRSHAECKELVSFWLPDVSVREVHRGSLVSDSANSPATSTRTFKARLVQASSAATLKPGTAFMLVSGTSQVECRISSINQLLNKTNGTVLQEKPEKIRVNDHCSVDITPSDSLLVMDTASKCIPLSAFAFLYKNKVIALGVVTEVTPRWTPGLAPRFPRNVSTLFPHNRHAPHRHKISISFLFVSSRTLLLTILQFCLMTAGSLF